MSSISAASPSTMPTYIDNLGSGRFRVAGERDADGDGVKDGESLTGAGGKVVNADELNAILQARGIGTITATATGLSSSDGFAITPGNSAIVSNTGIPALPDVTGPSAGLDTVGPKLSWLQEMQDASLMWLAMSTMAKVSQREMHDAKQLRNAMQEGKIDAKKAEINSEEKKISAERDAAMTKMYVAVAASVVSFIAGGNDNKAVSGAAGSFATTITAAGEAWSKNAGPGREADEAKLKGMRYQMMQEVFDQGVEDAKASYEEAKEQFKLALRIMGEHVERQSQVVQRITSA